MPRKKKTETPKGTDAKPKAEKTLTVFEHTERRLNCMEARMRSIDEYADDLYLRTRDMERRLEDSITWLRVGLGILALAIIVLALGVKFGWF